ncbi:hypothetical protein [Erwinia aphidicola]
MNPSKGRHLGRDIILRAVRWYYKYGISLLGDNYPVRIATITLACL